MQSKPSSISSQPHRASVRHTDTLGDVKPGIEKATQLVWGIACVGPSPQHHAQFAPPASRPIAFIRVHPRLFSSLRDFALSRSKRGVRLEAGGVTLGWTSHLRHSRPPYDTECRATLTP
jgi:hypothetical protein